MIGRIDEDRRLIVDQSAHAPWTCRWTCLANRRVCIGMYVMRAAATRFDGAGLSFVNCALDVLRHPTVASKSFLITIGDRTVGGMCSRDSMVGPWQIPVADCAVLIEL